MRRRLLAALGLVALAACASPTLPLPPPAQPSVGITSPGMVHLASSRGAEPNAIIVIVNANPNVPLNKRVSGSQADNTGSWDADVPASRGDVLEITQEFGATRSAPTAIQIQ